MIPGIAPAISKKKAADPGGGYSFTMTAGDAFGGAIVGYDGGYAVGTFGSINQQPIPGEILAFIYATGGNNVVSFIGNVLHHLSGLSLWIDGVQATFTNSWQYDAGPNFTAANWNPTTLPQFIKDQQYLIEIK